MLLPSFSLLPPSFFSVHCPPQPPPLPSSFCLVISHAQARETRCKIARIFDWRKSPSYLIACAAPKLGMRLLHAQPTLVRCSAAAEYLNPQSRQDSTCDAAAAAAARGSRSNPDYQRGRRRRRRTMRKRRRQLAVSRFNFWWRNSSGGQVKVADGGSGELGGEGAGRPSGRSCRWRNPASVRREEGRNEGRKEAA